MNTPDNLHRVWVMYRFRESGTAEEVVGAIVEGRLPTVIDHPPPEPFVAMVSFVWLGPAHSRTNTEGPTFSVRTVLQEPHPRKPVGERCLTIAAALAWLEEQKEILLRDGWTERDFDPEDDPD